MKSAKKAAKASKIVHTIPRDFRDKLNSHTKSLATWNDITPLAKNEWLCWIESVKKVETRTKHVQRAIEDLARGKRRPCCWAGCVHR